MNDSFRTLPLCCLVAWNLILYAHNSRRALVLRWAILSIKGGVEWCCVTFWHTEHTFWTLTLCYVCPGLWSSPSIILWGLYFRGKLTCPQRVELSTAMCPSDTHCKYSGLCLSAFLCPGLWFTLPIVPEGSSSEVRCPVHKGRSRRSTATLLCLAAAHIF